MFRTLDLIAVAVFAVSGALAAGRKRLDWIGVAVIAVVTAIGGGTIRDLLLDRHPIFWIADQTYLVVILIAAGATIVVARVRRPPPVALLVADALGLGMYGVVGTQIAERQGLPSLMCVVMGAITGVAGGVVRDVLAAEVPLVMREGTLYASAAIAGATAYLVLEGTGFPRGTAAIVGALLCVLIRFVSIAWNLRLPVFHVPEDPPGPTA